MPIVQVKGVANPIQFPDNMSEEEIKAILQQKFNADMFKRTTGELSDALTPVTNTAAPYSPSLVDRMGSGIADTLKDTGLISDNYGAQQIGKNVSALAEFLPGIGDATAGDEFGRAVAKGDNLGMGLAALGAIPVAGDIAKQALRKAKNINLPSGKLGSDQYKLIKQSLPMDEASRMARAKEQGFDVDAFHGTTHDFNEFNSDRLAKKGHFGGGHYFSSDIDDVNVNYAGRGPDLTGRIDRRAEQLADELDLEYDNPKVIAQATRELQGNEGLVLPIKLDTGKEFDLIDDTHLSYERDVPAWEDYLDDADGDEDIARELADEASWDNEPEGQLVDFMESIRNQADEHGFDADEVIGNLQEAATDSDGLSASEIDGIMRNTEWYAEDMETGDLINNEVYRQAIEDAGFDSIKHAGDIFQGMDIPYGTEHRIVFDPSRIRSSIGAKFDPKNKGSASLLGGLGALGLGIGLSQKEKEKDLN